MPQHVRLTVLQISPGAYPDAVSRLAALLLLSPILTGYPPPMVSQLLYEQQESERSSPVVQGLDVLEEWSPTSPCPSPPYFPPLKYTPETFRTRLTCEIAGVKIILRDGTRIIASDASVSEELLTYQTRTGSTSISTASVRRIALFEPYDTNPLLKATGVGFLVEMMSRERETVFVGQP